MALFAAGLIPKIRDILGSADLDTVSAKTVRKTLIAQGVDEGKIKLNKVSVDAVIAELFAEMRESGQPSKPRSSNSGYVKPSPQSSTNGAPTSSQIPLHDMKPRPSVKRERSGSLTPTPVSAPKKKAKREEPPAVVDDEAYARQLQAMLDGEFGGGRSSRAGKVKPKAKKVTGKEKKKLKTKSPSKVKDSDDEDEDDDDDDVKPKKEKKEGSTRGGAFNAEMMLSAPLAELTGSQSLSRPQVVKAIWAHVKANDLQDPNDKRYIQCDERLRKVFNMERVHMFSMNKILSKHIFNPKDVAGPSF